MSNLDDWLAPLAIDGEAIRFDLAGYRSVVTRQLLQARLRETPRAFATGDALLAANLTPDGAALLADAAALTAANTAVRARLETGPDEAIARLRDLGRSRRRLDRAAQRFGQGGPLAPYLAAAIHDQALGALKFALPDDLAGPFGDALLAPDGPSLWSQFTARELTLAEARRRDPTTYAKRLERHRRAHGYLFAEDIDFQVHETPQATDARIAALDDIATRRRQLRAARAADRARKLTARRRFAEALAAGAVHASETRVANVLLARALAAHEDQNRRAKMRLLRDLRDLAQTAGLDIATATLPALAAVRG